MDNAKRGQGKTYLNADDMQRYMGKIAHVYPDWRQRTATVACRITGLKYSWGKYLFQVAPLAGTGHFYVGRDRFELDQEDL